MTETVAVQTIQVKSNSKERTIDVPMPAILRAEDLKGLVAIAGDDMVFTKAMAQFVIDFRAKIRAMLESETDGALTHTDEAILALDFTDWKPEGRVRKTAEERARETLAALPPDVAKKILADLAKMQKQAK
jgi:hypothetical protein